MKNRIKELVEELSKASEAYYNTGESIMSDPEFDAKLKELQKLENETGIVMSNSPTVTVGATVLTELNKIKMDRPMLSLDKVHSAKEIIDFAQGQDLVAMVKCDGLSTRLVYEDGKFVAANTRGNGEEGSDITEHVKQFLNVPMEINFKGKLVVDGESIIKDSDFEIVNKNGEFKNSRNTASGTLSLLDTIIVKERRLSFIAWDVIEGFDDNSFAKRLEMLNCLGFEVVPYSNYETTEGHIDLGNDVIIHQAKEHEIPADGVVWKLDDITEGMKRGKTSHHFCNAVAWKPNRNTVETTLTDIEWQVGKTGQITPIAVFEPVELDGSTVTKASVHNVSILRQLDLHIGDYITVYKANMIIPQIDNNLSATKDREISFVPSECPCCKGKTELKNDNETMVLFCTNPDCQGKLLGKMETFVSKKGMNIDGMSSSTLQFLIDRGWLNDFSDVFKLSTYKEKWCKYDGFGKKSVEKLLNSIEKSRDVKLENFIAALSIPLIGKTASKELAKYCHDDIGVFNANINNDVDFSNKIDGFGKKMMDSIITWFNNKENIVMYGKLQEELNFIKDEPKQNTSNVSLKEKTFVVTGVVNHFKNRAELSAQIEELGGKVAGSVSSKTDYLINNDTESTSGKNKKAKELSIPIISEEEFLDMIK